jgi:hypothetical protein
VAALQRQRKRDVLVGAGGVHLFQHRLSLTMYGKSRQVSHKGSAINFS